MISEAVEYGNSDSLNRLYQTVDNYVKTFQIYVYCRRIDAKQQMLNTFVRLKKKKLTFDVIEGNLGKVFRKLFAHLIMGSKERSL